MATAAESHKITVRNKQGLHSKVSAKLVHFLTSFPRHALSVSSITEPVARDATDILNLLALAAGRGTELELSVTGPSADAIALAVQEFVEYYVVVDEIASDIRSGAQSLEISDPARLATALLKASESNVRYWLTFERREIVAARLMKWTAMGKDDFDRAAMQLHLMRLLEQY
jgi:phosphotransferase system HPr (HPr) family protein